MFVNSAERVSILFAILCTLYWIKDRLLERFIEFMNKNESCEELEELDMEEVEAGPGFGCTSPHIRRSTKSQAEKVMIAPISKQSLMNFMLYMMLYLSVHFLSSRNHYRDPQSELFRYASERSEGAIYC